MRKLVVGIFLTLDGVMQAPGAPDEDVEGGFKHGGWLVPYFDERLLQIMTEWTCRAGGFVLGHPRFPCRYAIPVHAGTCERVLHS